MEASTITVHWHNDNQPIYSIDFQSGPTPRLVTGGGDNNIRMWNLTNTNINNIQSVEYLSTLRKHSQAVNVVRFSPDGNLLASAGDDGTLMLWQLCDGIIKEFGDNEEDDDIKESWKVVVQFRSGTSEIMDVCWSPCGQYLVSGSMDNTIRVYQLDKSNDKIITGKLIHSLKSHSHYIQGVYWDPLDEYIVSQSADRSVNIYKIIRKSSSTIISDIKLLHKFSKYNGINLYHPESLQSFFRRLSFSPDGSLLVTPAGIEGESENGNNVAFVYTRASIAHTPVFKITGLSKPAIAVSFHPYKFQGNSKVIKLNYKMIFAIATQDSVIIYSTEEFKPMGYVSNLHYSTITDLRWDVQQSRLVICSTDGFCSVVKFEQGILGDRYIEPIPIQTSVAIPDDDIIEIEPQSESMTIEPTSTPVEPTIDTFFSKKKKRITPTLVS